MGAVWALESTALAREGLTHCADSQVSPDLSPSRPHFLKVRAEGISDFTVFPVSAKIRKPHDTFMI